MLHRPVCCLPAAGIDPYDASASAASDIVCFSASFHGRTMGALALTYKEQYKTPFAPIMPGAKLATYQDLDSAAQVIKKVSHRQHVLQCNRLPC